MIEFYLGDQHILLSEEDVVNYQIKRPVVLPNLEEREPRIPIDNLKATGWENVHHEPTALIKKLGLGWETAYFFKIANPVMPWLCVRKYLDGLSWGIGGSPHEASVSAKNPITAITKKINYFQGKKSAAFVIRCLLGQREAKTPTNPVLLWNYFSRILPIPQNDNFLAQHKNLDNIYLCRFERGVFLRELITISVIFRFSGDWAHPCEEVLWCEMFVPGSKGESAKSSVYEEPVLLATLTKKSLEDLMKELKENGN